MMRSEIISLLEDYKNLIPDEKVHNKIDKTVELLRQDQGTNTPREMYE